MPRDEIAKAVLELFEWWGEQQQKGISVDVEALDQEFFRRYEGASVRDALRTAQAMRLQVMGRGEGWLH